METRTRTRTQSPSLVEAARVREREAGGPPVPHNSLNIEIVDLTESNLEEESTTAEETVFLDTTNEGEVENSNQDQGGAQPGFLMFVSDAIESVLDIVRDEEDADSPPVVDTTIDLTDSPPRVPVSPVQETPMTHGFPLLSSMSG